VQPTVLGAASTKSSPSTQERNGCSRRCTLGGAHTRGLPPLRRICFLLLAAPSEAAYFHVEEGHERCFQESILLHQVLKMTYEMHDKEVLVANAEKASDCKIILKNPDGEVVKEHALVSENHRGVLAHAAQKEGSHSVCMSCHPQEWFERRKMRWTIAFDVLGENAIPGPKTKNLASLTSLKGTQNGVEQLMDRISAINTENNYERSQEIKFSRTTDLLNAEVAGLKMIQILCIVIVTGFQIHMVAQFLQRNRCFEFSCLPTRHKAMI